MTLPLLPDQTDTLEAWRPVIGYEGAYEVSNMGRVRSLDRSWSQPDRWGNITVRQWRGRLLALTVDRGKYAYGRLQVKLCGANGQRTRLVHHLVAEAFIGRRPESLEVAHNNGNATDNRLVNLRYATPISNSADKRLHGTHLVGERAPSAKLSNGEAARLMSLRGAASQRKLATDFGISEAKVSRILNGKQRGMQQ